MCTMNCILFGTKNLYDDEIRNRRVLEVGSRDANGSLRPFIESRRPEKYVGVDIAEGAGVDIICDAEKLLERFQVESFDIIISTELLEHVRNWQKAISNIKGVCKPGGIILVTTRSIGFKFHEHPHDFWRYELSDIESIFSDCDIQALEKDWEKGVFVKAIKPANFKEKDLSEYALFSIVTGERTKQITDKDLRSCYFRKLRAKRKAKDLAFEILPRFIASLLSEK